MYSLSTIIHNIYIISKVLLWVFTENHLPKSYLTNELRIRLSPLRWNTAQEELKGRALLMVSVLPAYHSTEGRNAGRLLSEWLGSRVTTMPRALSFLPGTLPGPPACGDSANHIPHGSFRLSKCSPETSHRHSKVRSTNLGMSQSSWQSALTITGLVIVLPLFRTQIMESQSVSCFIFSLFDWE